MIPRFNTGLFVPIYQRGRRLARWILIGSRSLPDLPDRLPRISIVTPARNAAATIEETLRSVLDQGYPDLEYIVVDGGSTDGTLEIVERYADRLAAVLRGPDNGMYDAVANGFDRATGTIFGYLNADDLLEPGALFTVVRALAANRDACAVYFEDIVAVNGWRFPNARQPWAVGTADLLDGHILFQDGVYFTAASYRRIGGLNRKLRLAGDWELWTRLSLTGRFARIRGHVSCFRIRPGQLSENFGGYLAELGAARAKLLAELPSWRRAVLAIGSWTRLPKRWRVQRRRLFYPYGPALANPLPRPAPSGPIPECPVDRSRPHRLLFASPDTRFGAPQLHSVWQCDTCGTAITAPAMAQSDLDALYRGYYSASDTTITAPEDLARSPFRGYWGGGLVERLISRVPWHAIPGSRLMNDPAEEVVSGLHGIVSAEADIRFLDVGCFEGALLDKLRDRTRWRLFGLEANVTAAAVAEARGHTVWRANAEAVPFAVPQDLRFDVIHMGQVIEHFLDPGSVLRRLSMVLAHGGAIVLTTPNLDSRQIELFGPTWAHWHVPFHRFFFTPRSLRKLAERSDFEVVSLHTVSHVYWTAMTLKLNELGLAGAVSHNSVFEPRINRRAAAITGLSWLIWNRIGRGDYIVAVLRKR